MVIIYSVGTNVVDGRLFVDSLTAYICPARSDMKMLVSFSKSSRLFDLMILTFWCILEAYKYILAYTVKIIQAEVSRYLGARIIFRATNLYKLSLAYSLTEDYL